MTYDEWGGFYDHVPPPRVIDDTDPSTVDHTGDATTPTDGQLIPNYRQLGFRVPTIVVSNLAPARVVHHGPFEHASTLKLIETTFGLTPLTARDTHAENLGQVLERTPRRPVRPGTIPTSARGAWPGERRGGGLQCQQRPIRISAADTPRQAASACPPSRWCPGRQVPAWPRLAAHTCTTSPSNADDGGGRARPPRSSTWVTIKPIRWYGEPTADERRLTRCVRRRGRSSESAVGTSMR